MLPNDQRINLFPCHNGHTHPRSAEFRSSANDFMQTMATTNGYTPYCVSRNNRDVGDGSRYFYHMKDYHCDFRDDPVGADHAFIFTDVDYYADMNQWLMHWKPIMMYTLVPQQLSYRGEEFAYYFNEASELNYHVRGGAQYKHQLWKYEGDSVCVVDQYGALCIFDVEQREVEGDPHHRIIWLLPKARLPFLSWIFNPNRDGYTSLERLNVVSGKICYLWNALTDFLSVKPTGSKYSVELDGELFHSIKARLANKDTPPRTSDIERMLNTGGFDTAKSVRAAPLLLACWEFDRMPTNMFSTGKFPTNFTALPRRNALATEDATNVGQAVTTPLVTRPAMFAAKGVNPELSCIEGRINKPRNDRVPSKKYKDYAREFVNLVVPDKMRGTIPPLSMDEVNEKQDGKLQRARFHEVIHGMSVNVKNSLKGFIKTEAYSCPNEPRNITTMTPDLTVAMSCFTLALSVYFKEFRWYGVGKSPKQTIRELRRTSTSCETGTVDSDYDRFDGSVSKFLQTFVTLPICMKLIPESYRPEFKNHFDQVFKKSATTSSGIRYDAGWGTRSGSPLTSFNTLKNAFNSYCALRETGNNPKEAFAKLGIYVGDDGSTANWGGTYADSLVKVVKELGQSLKIKIIPKHDPMPFCGRYFVDPATVDDSFQDPMRTLTKIHLSGNKGVSREQAAANRARGYLTTDSLTPLIGTYCKRTLELVGNLKFKGGTHEEIYKCSNAWPQNDYNLILDAMAKVLGITSQELLDMEGLVDAVNDLDQFPILIDNLAPAKTPAIVDGELVGTDPHHSAIPIPQLTQRSNNERQPKTSNRLLEPRDRNRSRGNPNILEANQPRVGAQTPKPRERRIECPPNTGPNQRRHNQDRRPPRINEDGAPRSQDASARNRSITNRRRNHLDFSPSPDETGMRGPRLTRRT